MKHYQYIVISALALSLVASTGCNLSSTTNTSTNTAATVNTAQINKNAAVVANTTSSNTNTSDIDTSDLPSAGLAEEGWETYVNEKIGINFLYPTLYNTAVVEIEDCTLSVECTSKEGASFFWYYSDPQERNYYSVAGSSTVGFGSGRDFRFTDVVRFEKKEDQYNIILPNDDFFQVNPLKTINTNIGTAIIYSVKDLPSYPMMSEEKSGDQIAILNLNFPVYDYQSISFYIPLTMTDQDVEAILNSVALAE